MSRPNEIHILNPFNLQYGSNFAVWQHIQEIINYVESRFAATIIAIETMGYNPAMHHLMYQRLQDELAFILTFIGKAFATRMQIHLGMVVRSLADSIGIVDQASQPYRVDQQFLAFIKSKADNWEKEICDIINNYHCAWWRRTFILGGPVLCSQTVNECLKVHQNEQHKAGVFRHVVHHPILPPIGLPSSSTSPDQQPFHCRTCVLYRHSLADTQASLIQVKNFASAQRDTAKLKADLACCAMAAAHCLQEVYIAKASAVAKAGEPMPLDMTEDKISALVPIATQSIQRIVGQILTVPAWVNASAEAAITARLDMHQSTPIPLANASHQLAPSGLPQQPLTTDSGPVVDMFRSLDEEADRGIPPAMPDMFKSDKDAALPLPSAMDMFGYIDETQPIDDTRNVNAMDMFGSDEEVSGNDAGTSFPPAAPDMFGSGDEDDAPAAANENPATQPPVNPVPAAITLPSTERIPSDAHTAGHLANLDIHPLAALTIQETPAVNPMSELPAVADMFAESSSDGSSDAGHVDDMFSSDGEDEGSSAKASDEEEDSAALDMFSEHDASDADSSAAPYGRFTAADFAELDDGLFDEPVVDDSD